MGSLVRSISRLIRLTFNFDKFDIFDRTPDLEPQSVRTCSIKRALEVCNNHHYIQ